jgi:hypothetical protein
MVSASFARSWAHAIRQLHERAQSLNLYRHAAAHAGRRSERCALKALGRRFGLRAIAIREQPCPEISLSDSQLRAVMMVAADVPQEKRGLFLERLSAMLTLRGRGRYTDDDLIEIAKLARTGLAHQPAA